MLVFSRLLAFARVSSSLTKIQIGAQIGTTVAIAYSVNSSEV
jgi:hypothetical protein